MNENLITIDYLMKEVQMKEAYDEVFYPESLTTLTYLLLFKRLAEKGIKKEDLLKRLEGEKVKIPKSIVSEWDFRNWIAKALADDSLRETMASFSILTEALAIFTYVKAKDLIKASDLSLSLNMEAIRGELGAFDLRLHGEARPYESQYKAASNVLEILNGSEMTTDQGRFAFGYDTSQRCQDAISYRAAPQTHGGVRDTLSFLKEAIDKAIKNPESPHHDLRYALDFLMIGLSDLGNISERRSFRLTDTHLSYGLPTNLVYENPGFNHGFPVVQAVATAVLGELKTYALPTRLGFNERANNLLPLSSAIRACESLQLISKVIAIEVFMSVQGMDIVREALPNMSFGKGSRAAYERVRDEVATVKENRYLISDMRRLDGMIYTGELLESVELVIGELK